MAVPLVLASTSQYRRQLLERLRLPFQVSAPQTDESPLPGELPHAIALRLAEAKARAVSGTHPNALIIGSDQVADLDGKPLGKPGNHNGAVRQLQAMSGKRVVFHTALCVINSANGRMHLENVQTIVTLRHLSRDSIDTYLRLDQPYDCAGSAKVESLGIVLAESIDSADPTALIGLPLIALVRMLRAEGVCPLQGQNTP